MPSRVNLIVDGVSQLISFFLSGVVLVYLDLIYFIFPVMGITMTVLKIISESENVGSRGFTTQ